MKVVIAGTGNVATVLGKKIKAAGHEICEVYGRELTKAKDLAQLLGAKATDDLSAIYREADIYIIAVSDAAISEIANQLSLPGKLVVHTAASVPASVLSKASSAFGVIYPLQSLRKIASTIPEIPVFIDGPYAQVIEQIRVFTETVFEQTTIASDAERLKLHVVAVLVSNFTNHLFALAEQFCVNENLDFTQLLPLMQETVDRLHNNKAMEMQTGPALRNDTTTINAHLQLLEKYPGIKAIYTHLTQSITSLHSKAV